MDKGVKIFLKFWDFEEKWLREFARQSLFFTAEAAENAEKIYR